MTLQAGLRFCWLSSELSTSPCWLELLCSHYNCFIIYCIFILPYTRRSRGCLLSACLSVAGKATRDLADLATVQLEKLPASLSWGKRGITVATLAIQPCMVQPSAGDGLPVWFYIASALQVPHQCTIQKDPGLLPKHGAWEGAGYLHAPVGAEITQLYSSGEKLGAHHSCQTFTAHLPWWGKMWKHDCYVVLIKKAQSFWWILILLKLILRIKTMCHSSVFSTIPVHAILAALFLLNGCLCDRHLWPGKGTQVAIRVRDCCLGQALLSP